MKNSVLKTYSLNLLNKIMINKEELINNKTKIPITKFIL